MINESVVIAGTARDVEPYIDRVMENILAIGKLFNKFKILIVESDSTDNSVHMLEQFKRVELHSLGDLSHILPSRTDRLAYCRNYYLDIVETRYRSYDNLLVLDLDSENTCPIDSENIVSNFKHKNWDMITANQHHEYYDMWALRTYDDWCPGDCFKNKKPNEPLKFVTIPPEGELIKVRSAFGGAGFIKINKIKGTRHVGNVYGGFNSQNNPISEWVPFCEKLNNVYINPQFIIQKKRNSHVRLM